MNNYSWKQTNSNLNDKASRLNLFISLNSYPNSARFQFINSNSLGKIFKCIWKISFSSFRKCYRLSGSEQPATIGNTGIWYFLLTQQFFWYFNPQYLTNGNSKAHRPYHFMKNLTRSFRCSKYFAPDCDKFSAVISRKYKKNESFVTLGVKSTLWALTVGIFHFRILTPVKFNSLGSLLSIMFWSVKCTFTCQRWHFQDY